MNHTELLNHLAKKHNLKSYLEIGVKNPANNFNKINIPFKVGVDPDVKDNNVIKLTSDKYFNLSVEDYYSFGWAAFCTNNNVLTTVFDLIFIDGLHHADQVKRDFENSLQCLNDNGFIVIHDCLPEDEITTCVPRGNQKVWHGDVYKFCMTMRQYQGVDFLTYNFDNGCMVVWKDDKRDHEFWADVGNNWESYLKHRRGLMKIIEWQPELL